MRDSTHTHKKENQSNDKQSFSKSGIIIDPEYKTKYRKGRKLGGGGFGEVYEFIDIETNKKRAAKIIPNSRIDNDPQSNIAYNNEYKFNTYLDFKYLCKCFSTFKDSQNAYFILDYQPNKTLTELLLRRHLSEIEIKHYGFELLLAIEYLHKRNIIHRDIKLSNVLLSEKMEVRLCDFGLAIENGLDYQKNICGTPNYIAPELLNHKNGLNYSFEIDIWAFGVMLYTLFFNKTPFEEKAKGKTKYNIQHIIYNFPNNTPISKEAKDLISSILVKEPSQRPKIEQIKSSAFFNNGEGIPKYLPVSTMVRAMSPEEEENFVNTAIKNGECLDKDNNLANRNTSFSIRAKYYNRGNGNILESEKNYSDKSSSSNEENNSNNEKNKNSNINEGILKSEKNTEKNFKENERNEKQSNKNTLNSNHGHFIYNKEKETFNSFSNNEEKNNISREEELIKFGKFLTIGQQSTKKDLSNYYNNSKSYGKMNETAGFISNNISNSNSEFFSPLSKFKDSRDNSNLMSDEFKLNNNGNKNNIKISQKFNLTKKKLEINSLRNDKENNNINTSRSNSLNKNDKINTSKSNSNSYIQNENKDKNGTIMKDISNIKVYKFIDLSEKCGVGYILTNGDIGACFNDGTKMIRIKCTLNFIYFDINGNIKLINTKKGIKDKDYEVKINALLLFTKAFIKNSKNRNSFAIDPKLHKKSIDLYVKKWVKSRHAYFFLLSNEKVQVIFDDKTQVIFDFINKKAIFINKLKQKIIQNMCLSKFGNEEMNKRVNYAKKVLGKL